MTLPRFRFSIRRLMLLVLVVAVLLATYRFVDRVLLISVGVLLVFALVWWLIFRNHPRLSAWVFAIGSIATNVLIAYFCVYFVCLGGFGVMGMVTVLVLPMAMGCGASWASRARLLERPMRRPSWPAWTTVVVLCASPITMMVGHWPLQLAFLVSKPALDKLADRTAAGRPVKEAERAGVFEVVRSAFDPTTGEVALYIDNDPYGQSGFLRLAPGRSESGSLLFTNLNFDDHLDGRWRYRNED